MNDFWQNAVSALLFGLAWAGGWGILLCLLLATSPPHRTDDTTEAQEAEDDNPHPAHAAVVDGEARRL